jgi:putative ABC transport system ATP-binding protein
VIELAGVSAEAGGRVILRAPDWRHEAGAALLIGPSGSGKTTLLNVIAGLLTPTRGSVRVWGQDLFALSPAKRDQFRGKSIGFVFQTLRLVRALSVEGNLALALRLARAPQDKRAIQDALQRLNIAHLAKAHPHTLSVGESQRAAIARALVTRPKLVLADEPTSALDDENAISAIDLLLHAAQDFGASLIVATHDQRIKTRVPHHLILQRPS